MAEFESPSPGAFNITETFESQGNAQLLDMLNSETVTTDPNKIVPNKEEEKPKPVAIKAKKEETPTEKKKEDSTKPLKSFLGSEEEEGEEQPKEEEEEEGDEEVSTSQQFTALAKELTELGVFTKNEGETDIQIESPQAFLERFTQEKKKAANDTIETFLSQFGDDYKQAFDAIYLKGVDPKEYWSSYNELSDVASLDLKDEDNQIAIIKKGLQNQGFEPEDITAELERVKNYGDLEGVATRYHKVLLKDQTAKIEQMQAASEARIKQEQLTKSQYLKNVQTVIETKLQKKEFDGIPLNPQLASELRDFLVTDKYKTPNGELLTEFDRTVLDLKRPENHEKKVKLALLLKVLEKDPTLSTIQKTGVTKTTDKLFSEVVKQKSIAKVEKTEKPTSWFK